MFHSVRRQDSNKSEPVHEKSSFPEEWGYYTMESKQCQIFSAFVCLWGKLFSRFFVAHDGLNMVFYKEIKARIPSSLL